MFYRFPILHQYLNNSNKHTFISNKTDYSSGLRQKKFQAMKETTLAALAHALHIEIRRHYQTNSPGN